MASLSDIRTALANQLATISGLRTSAQYVSQINPPMAVILPASGVNVQPRTLDGSEDYQLIIHLLVAYTEDSSSQALLDGYLDPSGATSIQAALRANPSLGGKVMYAVTGPVAGYGLLDWAGQQYLGTRVPVTVAV